MIAKGNNDCEVVLNRQQRCFEVKEKKQRIELYELGIRCRMRAQTTWKICVYGKIERKKRGGGKLIMLNFITCWVSRKHNHIFKVIARLVGATRHHLHLVIFAPTSFIFYPCDFFSSSFSHYYIFAFVGFHVFKCIIFLYIPLGVTFFSLTLCLVALVLASLSPFASLYVRHDTKWLCAPGVVDKKSRKRTNTMCEWHDRYEWRVEKKTIYSTTHSDKRHSLSYNG